MAEQGRGKKGLPRCSEAYGALPGHGGRGGHAYLSGLLAEAYGKAGQAEEGLAVLEPKHWLFVEKWGASGRGGVISIKRGANARM